jgi:hypothetical protein
LLAEVAGKGRDALRPHPDATISDFDVGKDVRDRELALLALRRLVRVGRQRRDIDEPGHAGIGAGCRDESAAIRMANQDDRAADAPDRALHYGHVAGKRVEAVLGGDEHVPSACKVGINLLKDEPSAQIPWTKAWTWFAPLMRCENDKALVPGIRCAAPLERQQDFVCSTCFKSIGG